MVDFQELDFSGIKTVEDVEAMLKEKLGVDFLFMGEALCKSLVEKAEELTHDFANVAPNGEYDKLLEDNDSMAEFFKGDAAKPENWKVYEIEVSKQSAVPLLQISFHNTVVDDGTTLEGHVFLNQKGAIRHAFVQGNGQG